MKLQKLKKRIPENVTSMKKNEEKTDEISFICVKSEEKEVHMKYS